MRHASVRTRNALVLALASLIIGVGQAREPQSAAATPKVDVESLGPRVGAALPDFTLRDQRGEAHSLKSLLGPRGALIVFFRSADW
jgi:cytochrome oxidase Cu insertion factor (SCO1/SenC/PrrC family)